VDTAKGKVDVVVAEGATDVADKVVKAKVLRVDLVPAVPRVPLKAAGLVESWATSKPIAPRVSRE